MKHESSDKYTIAWFKLADCISKGEREKAFGVYRLLAHSLEDQAYAMKLEGDLFSAFNDMKAAFEKYEQAALTYLRHKQFKEAATLYEDLVILVEKPEKYLSQLCDLYKNHLSAYFLKSKYIKLCESLLENGKPEFAEAILQEIESYEDLSLLGNLYQKFICALIKKNFQHTAQFQLYLEKTLQILMTIENQHDLQAFLSTLQAIDQQIYSHAVEFLNK